MGSQILVSLNLYRIPPGHGSLTKIHTKNLSPIGAAKTLKTTQSFFIRDIEAIVCGGGGASQLIIVRHRKPTMDKQALIKNTHTHTGEIRARNSTYMRKQSGNSSQFPAHARNNYRNTENPPSAYRESKTHPNPPKASQASMTPEQHVSIPPNQPSKYPSKDSETPWCRPEKSVTEKGGPARGPISA